MNCFLAFFLFLVPIILFFVRGRRSSVANLPPGSLGFPIIGQSITLLRAMRANTAEEWVQRKIQKYGPISKLRLFGKPTVLVSGQAANKLVFASDSSIISNSQTKSVRMILGERNLLELKGQDHRRVRDALTSFLKPESLKRYVGKIDEEVRLHIQMHWQGKQEIKVLPLMKTLTFNIICCLLFGMERGFRREKLIDWFQEMIEGMWSIPVNLPFTRYNHSLRARASVQNMVMELIKEKREELRKGADPHQDLITCLLSIRDQNDEQVMTDKEVSDNVVLVMVAGHDTSSVLITFLMRLLANEPAVYASILQEHEEIAKNKITGELLTWEDLAKMKQTWRVAMETLRMFPPIFGGFRTALTDIEFEGYLIPKGWQIFWVTGITHMDDRIFPEPAKFDPARFENQTPAPPYCYIPFGGGPRICPGYEFAKIETLVTIHYLITHFTWKKLCSDNFFSRDPMPVPTGGLPIRIRPKTQM